MITKNNKENNVVNKDKYNGKPIQFYYKDDHYELYFLGDIPYPIKDYTIISNVVNDLENADKSKELYIYIIPYQVLTIILEPILKQISKFKHVVTITSSCMSCGFMLWCCGNEKYIYEDGFFIKYEKSEEKKRYLSDILENVRKK